jgi:hypothetical protein
MLIRRVANNFENKNSKGVDGQKRDSKMRLPRSGCRFKTAPRSGREGSLIRRVDRLEIKNEGVDENEKAA